MISPNNLSSPTFQLFDVFNHLLNIKKYYLLKEIKRIFGFMTTFFLQKIREMQHNIYFHKKNQQKRVNSKNNFENEYFLNDSLQQTSFVLKANTLSRLIFAYEQAKNICKWEIFCGCVIQNSDMETKKSLISISMVGSARLPGTRLLTDSIKEKLTVPCTITLMVWYLYVIPIW